jgi:guanylate cyclase soluble subunit beta
MIGVINIAIRAFVVDTFGQAAWQQVVEGADVRPNWISSCPYPDSHTFDIVVHAARLLGITVDQAIEAFGCYFVGYLVRAGYGKLLQCLGELPSESCVLAVRRACNRPSHSSSPQAPTWPRC